MTARLDRPAFSAPALAADAAYWDASSWVAAHVAAFAFFGACPRRLVPDNLATGVDRPDIYDPRVNRAYAEMAAHYGALVDPARRGKRLFAFHWGA